VNFLRTATVLTALGKVAITEDSLLGALAIIEARVEKTFSRGKIAETKRVRSMVVPQTKLDTHQIDIVCDTPQLCLKAEGEQYLVIDKALIDANGLKVEVIDQNYLHYLLDIAASSYALEDCWPTGEGGKKQKWQIMASKGFAEGREAILDRASRL
jgi:hypothetical protein